MHDPYLYDDMPVLRNLLNIKNAELLERAEADITAFYFSDIDGAITSKEFDFERLLEIHKYIFNEIYDWAGAIRTIPMVKGERVLGGDTIRYSHPNEIKKECTAIIQKLNDILG